jgi:hypothetical protein
VENRADKASPKSARSRKNKPRDTPLSQKVYFPSSRLRLAALSRSVQPWHIQPADGATSLFSRIRTVLIFSADDTSYIRVARPCHHSCYQSVIMILMNFVVALVAGLILFEPFTRAPVSRSVQFSDHRTRAKRAFVQAGVAFMAAMVVATSNPSPDRIPPMVVFGSATVLATAGVYWALRGKSLLKPRKMFGSRH